MGWDETHLRYPSGMARKGYRKNQVTSPDTSHKNQQKINIYHKSQQKINYIIAGDLLFYTYFSPQNSYDFKINLKRLPMTLLISPRKHSISQHVR